MNSDARVNHVRSALTYVRRFSGTTVLIKLGGAALQDPELVSSICEDLTLIRSAGISVVLVHGGGPSINQELTRRGIQWEFLEGQRITTPEMMEVIERVLCGSVNRTIVRTLNASGVPAVGISGGDAQTLLCKAAHPKLGQVGQIETVNTGFILSVMDQAIPVIAPIGVGRDGTAFNINADWAASRIAQSLGVGKLIFLTDQDGILDSNKKLIPELDAAELENLIENGTVQGGMLAKTRTILHALRHGVKDIHVLNARRPHGLIEELFTDQGVGTACRLRSLSGGTSV